MDRARRAAAHRQRVGSRYRAIARDLRGRPCWRCGVPSTTVGHVPPLDTFADPAEWVGLLLPECAACNYAEGARIANAKKAGMRTSRRW